MVPIPFPDRDDPLPIMDNRILMQLKIMAAFSALSSLALILRIYAAAYLTSSRESWVSGVSGSQFIIFNLIIDSCGDLLSKQGQIYSIV